MCATHDEMVSILTVNKRREPSPDLLRHSNAELCAATSSSLISLLQHGGLGERGRPCHDCSEDKRGAQLKRLVPPRNSSGNNCFWGFLA